ncbi:MAG: hypothetical protein AAGE59_30400 [Cyanobacteria bacterium P01_F01_bin.86]
MSSWCVIEEDRPLFNTNQTELILTPEHLSSARPRYLLNNGNSVLAAL